jgi:hypothetical protein
MDHPLIVDLLVGMTRLTRALMDRGSDLNHMYLDTFDGLGLTQDHHQSSPHPFYGGVPGKKSTPLGWVTQLVISGDASNYRTETFIFEMVDFSRPYPVILEWPCYVMFMAILCYAYLKLKIPGPARVITVEAKAQQALNYKHDNIELATAVVITSELRELGLQAPSVSSGLTVPPRLALSKRLRMLRSYRLTPKTLPR